MRDGEGVGILRGVAPSPRWLLALLLVAAVSGCESLDQQCAESVVCEMDGLCSHDPSEGCVARSEELCRASRSCVQHGRCTLTEGRCLIASDDDCEAALVCKEDQSCQRILGWDNVAQCVPECHKREPCRAAGYCQQKGDRCLPGSDADCRRSEICRRLGRCIVGPDGHCDISRPRR